MEEIYEDYIPCSGGGVMQVRIKKGDTVEAISGREKGKTGKVLKVLSSKKGSRYVLVEKINMIKKHMKPSQKNKEGGILEKEGPMHISNVSVVCPKCGKATRVGVQVGDDKKMRYCKKCREIID